MATKEDAQDRVIHIKSLEECYAKIRVIGKTPLIVHAWSEKNKRLLKGGRQAMEEMSGKKKGITQKNEDHAGPMEGFIDSMYWIRGKPAEYTREAFDAAVAAGAQWGFKVTAFKNAAVDAAYTKRWIPNKKSVRGVFFIEADAYDVEGNPLVRIQGDPPIMREDIVRLNGIGQKPDLRWRGEFRNWFCDLTVNYDPDSPYTLEDFCNMLNVGGRYNGVGEWRPEKNGINGQFRLATEADMAEAG